MLSGVILCGAERAPAIGDRWAPFSREVLDHARIPYAEVEGWSTACADARVAVFSHPPDTAVDAIAELTEWVRSGGVAIAVGGAGALAPELGIAVRRSVEQGRVTFRDGRSAESMPAFGGVELTTQNGGRVLADWVGATPAAAVIEAPLGTGKVIVSGVDLWQTVCRILQGWPVLADGVPPADGTAPIDDGVLKCDDGIALDFEADRALPPGQPPLTEDYEYTFPPPTANPIFDRPQADRWRTAFLRLLFDAAQAARLTLPWLYYWPGVAPAIAHLSVDTDGNLREHAETTLDVFASAEVHATWCHLHPGYDDETISRIGAAGHEHALHFDALSNTPELNWSRGSFSSQLRWLSERLEGVPVVTNKNHYTRWEGWDDLYLWCEEVGIEIEQSRGGSKLGSSGFPFGTTHVWFPHSSPRAGSRRIDVLAMPLHTQDLGLAGHESTRDVILDGAVAEHGLAHFLFHPMHFFERDYVRDAFARLVDAVRRRGIDWWTAAEINRWERQRRQVSVQIARDRGGNSATITVTSRTSVSGATVLVPADTETYVLTAAPPGASTHSLECHGLRFFGVTLDLEPGDTTIVVDQVR